MFTRDLVDPLRIGSAIWYKMGPLMKVTQKKVSGLYCSFVCRATKKKCFIIPQSPLIYDYCGLIGALLIALAMCLPTSRTVTNERCHHDE